MGDCHIIGEKEGTSLEGDRIIGQNQVIMKMEQRIPELQAELAQVCNLAKLSLNLNTLELQADSFAIPKSQDSSNHPIPHLELQNPTNIQNIQNTTALLYMPTQEPRNSAYPSP